MYHELSHDIGLNAIHIDDDNSHLSNKNITRLIIGDFTVLVTNRDVQRVWKQILKLGL